MDSSPSFLEAWHSVMIIASIVMFAAGVLVFILYHVRLSMITDYKAKYDFINLREVRNLRLVFILFGLSALMAINLYGMGKVDVMGVWFFVRFFISVAGGTLIFYVA